MVHLLYHQALSLSLSMRYESCRLHRGVLDATSDAGAGVARGCLASTKPTSCCCETILLLNLVYHAHGWSQHIVGR